MTGSTDIAIERHGDSVAARLNGDVDMTNSGFVEAELRGCMPNDASALVVDLAGVLYLDSSGVAVLFDLSRRLARRRQALRVVVPPGSPLRRLLDITEVGSIASVHESLEEAVHAG